MYEDTAEHLIRYLHTLTDFAHAIQVILGFRMSPQCQTLDVYHLRNVPSAPSIPTAASMQHFMDKQLEQLTRAAGQSGTKSTRAIANARVFLTQSLLGTRTISIHPEAALMALAHSVRLGENGPLQDIARREDLFPVSRNRRVCLPTC